MADAIGFHGSDWNGSSLVTADAPNERISAFQQRSRELSSPPRALPINGSPALAALPIELGDIEILN
jgi:hypothetical protein